MCAYVPTEDPTIQIYLPNFRTDNTPTRDAAAVCVWTPGGTINDTPDQQVVLSSGFHAHASPVTRPFLSTCVRKQA
jgi:hypothetical protein